MNKETWISCDSKSDMIARTKSLNTRVFEELETEDANAWGIFYSEVSGYCIPISFFDAGLLPKQLVCGEAAFIGIADIVAGYELDSGRLSFKYRVPTVFHDFASIGSEMVVVQDETGFIGLDKTGKQRWIKLLSDIVEEYKISGSTIYGTTMDGDVFEFHI